MGEIKSAIELAMERTKGLVMDEKEKQEVAARELSSRIGGLLRRYLEEMIDWDGFRKEYEKIDGKKTQKSELLIDMALDEFDLSDDNERVFDVLSYGGGDVDDQRRREIEELQSEFHAEITAEAADVKKSILARLQKMGISGNGLEPNVTEWDEWRSAVEQTKSLFKKRLSQWKNKIAQNHTNQ